MNMDDFSPTWRDYVHPSFWWMFEEWPSYQERYDNGDCEFVPIENCGGTTSDEAKMTYRNEF